MAGTIKGITVEIEGETTGLQKALSSVDKQSKSLQSELKQIDKLLKLDPKNTELVAQKQKVLGEQIAVTKERLQALRDAQAQVNEQYEKGEISEEQYRAFQREITATEQKLKGYEDELKRTAEAHSNLTEKLEQTSKKLKDVGGKMTDVGKDMSMKVTAPIVAGAAASIKAFTEVDEAMDTVVMKTGATGEAAKQLQEACANVVGRMPVDIQEAGEAVGELNTQFGLIGQPLEEATEQVLKFAAITGVDATTAVLNAKAAIDAYGLTAADLPTVLDAIAKAAQDTGASVDQISQAVIKGAPQIKDMGLDFATAAEVMGRFEQKGLDSSKALTYLAKAQVVWAKEGKTLQEGLAELESKLAASTSGTEKLTAASEVFGTKGAVFMLDALERGAFDFNDFASAAQDATGTVSATFTETLDPIDKAKTALNNLKLVGAEFASALQDVLAPMLDKVVGALRSLSDWFSNLSPQTQEMIVKVGLIAAAIGPVVLVLGKLVSGIGSAIGVVAKLGPVFSALTGPIGIAVAAIGAVVAIGITLYRHWDEISKWLGDVWNGIKETASTVWNSIASFFTGCWNGIKSTAETVWNAIKDFLSDLWNGIKGVATTVWEGVKTAVTTPVDTAKNLLSTAWEGIESAASTAWNGIKSVAGTVWGGIKTAITTPIDSVKSVLSTAWGTIKQTATDAWNGLKREASNIFNKVKNAIVSPFQNIHIPMPHFSFSVKHKSIAGISIPYPDVDVNWYRTGGIFSAPTIIGVGEAGAEAVLPIDKLSSILADTLRSMGIQTAGGPTVIVQNMTVRDESDIYRISRELSNLMQTSRRASGVR